jgi:hypothetical protein
MFGIFTRKCNHNNKEIARYYKSYSTLDKYFDETHIIQVFKRLKCKKCLFEHEQEIFVKHFHSINLYNEEIKKLKDLGYINYEDYISK